MTDLDYPSVEKWEMTWAPSHVELGLLSELLRYANIIDGLDETKKRELRDKLQGRKTVYREGRKGWMIEKNVIQELGEAKHVESFPDFETEEWVFCLELCPEYIDYLRKVLKPYLRT